MKKYITGFFMAWGNFFWIPCPVKRWDNELKSCMLSWLPTVGLLIAICWNAAYMLLEVIGLHSFLRRAILTALPFLLSGCIHVDGFMDCADALGSRGTVEKKQSILKDSRVGTFAVIELLLVVLIYFAGIYAADSCRIYPGSILMIFVMPRSVAGLEVMLSAPMGVSQYNGMKREGMGLLLIQIVMLALLGMIIEEFSLNCLTATVFSGGAAWVAADLAKDKLGGMNGDIAGYSIIWGELLGVIALSLY